MYTVEVKSVAGWTTHSTHTNLRAAEDQAAMVRGRIAEKPYVAFMRGIGQSWHSTEAAAKRGLGKFRADYRATRQTLPYPEQIITHHEQVIYHA